LGFGFSQETNQTTLYFTSLFGYSIEHVYLHVEIN